MRVPFQIMVLEVEKLFEQSLQETDLVKIDKACSLIEFFIQSCGYSVEEYARYVLEDRLPSHQN